MWAVYRLFDKQDPTITRYVGLTRNPHARLLQHLLCNGGNPGKDSWIQETGERVAMEIIEETNTFQEGREREAFWIHRYLEAGDPLTNILIPSQEPREPTGERRFDVRIPDANTELLALRDSKPVPESVKAVCLDAISRPGISTIGLVVQKTDRRDDFLSNVS